MENRIKECLLDPFADRTGTATLRPNAAADLESPRRTAVFDPSIASNQPVKRVADRLAG